MPRSFLVRTLTVILLLLAAAPRRAAGAERAAWVWQEDSYAMLDSKSLAKEAIMFSGAKGIGTLYLYADAYNGRNLLREKPKLYRKFIRRLHKGGVKVYALLGSAELASPELKAEALAAFRRVLDYNSKAGPLERFDGVNLDLEPHLLGEWETERDRLLLYFLDLGAEFMAMKKTADPALEVGPAIPFWLDGIELERSGVKKPVSEHVIDIYDYVALMDYRDRAEGSDGLIALAASELAYAGLNGKKVLVGVEVAPNEIKKVSFDRNSEAELEWELLLAADAFEKEPAFGGFVIHHYGSYKAWLRRWEWPGKSEESINEKKNTEL